MTWGERILLAALALLVFLPGIGSRDLWNPDEPRYAEVAQEMAATGSWFVPLLNGRVYSEKPPLLFWLIAAFDALPGVELEVAARLPSLLAVVATLLLLFDLVRRLFDGRVAWLAVMIFLSSAKILWQGRVGQIDMLLIALVTAAMAAFVRGLVDERPGFYRLFFLLTGVATLAKGPAGMLPPLLAIVAWTIAAGRFDVLRALRIPTGLLLWAAIVALWLVPAGVAGGSAYLETLVFRQNLTRYAEPWHHLQPWYYYLTIIPVDFFPWSFLLPGALWLGARRLTGEARRGFTLMASWLIVTLLFFSISPAKRTVYILTMYPALAAIVAAALCEIESSWSWLRRWLTVPTALLAGLLTLAPIAIALAIRFVPDRLERPLAELSALGPGILPRLALLAIVLALGAQLAWLAARQGDVRRTVYALAGGISLAAVLAAVLLLPRFDVVKSARPIAAKLVELVPAAEPYAMWPRLDATVIVYSGRFAVELASREELYAFARRPAKIWLLIKKAELAKLPEPLPLVEAFREEQRTDGYALLTSRPQA